MQGFRVFGFRIQHWTPIISVHFILMVIYGWR